MADEGNNEGHFVGQCTSNFAGIPTHHVPPPPYFANPFMAPFLPQQHGHLPTTTDTNSDRSSLSPSSSSSSPNDPHLLQQRMGGKTEFRMNPLTGGYFLSPSQYHEMVQYKNVSRYYIDFKLFNFQLICMQNLMINNQECVQKDDAGQLSIRQDLKPVSTFNTSDTSNTFGIF